MSAKRPTPAPALGRAPVASVAARRVDLAALAERLTDRDRLLCRLVEDHRVLTTRQVCEISFESLNAAQHRLVILARLGVLERFRPAVPYGAGSAPWHYVLGPAGAAILAAERGHDPTATGYRRDRALAIAHSQRLGHLTGVNGFFTSLAAWARHHPQAGAALLEWWPERRCAERWGRVVRPDGYGRWRHRHHQVDFFLEYDNGTEDLGRLTGKLAGYADLAAVSGITTPVLVWVPGPGREAALRRLLSRPPVPVATAAARGGAHGRAHPAEPVWLPAGITGPRRPLANLTPGQ